MEYETQQRPPLHPPPYPQYIWRYRMRYSIPDLCLAHLGFARINGSITLRIELGSQFGIKTVLALPHSLPPTYFLPTFAIQSPQPFYFKGRAYELWMNLVCSSHVFWYADRRKCTLNLEDSQSRVWDNLPSRNQIKSVLSDQAWQKRVEQVWMARPLRNWMSSCGRSSVVHSTLKGIIPQWQKRSRYEVHIHLSSHLICVKDRILGTDTILAAHRIQKFLKFLALTKTHKSSTQFFSGAGTPTWTAHDWEQRSSCRKWELTRGRCQGKSFVQVLPSWEIY